MIEAPPSPAPRTAAPGAGPPRPSGGAPAKDLLQESRKLQQLVQQAETLRDPVARALVHECLHALLAFYGDGLARLLQVVQGCGPDGQHVFDRLLRDPVVRGLLLIHGLHPQGLRTRLEQAIAKIRPYMESHGGNVELLSLENDVARLRLQGACKTCPSSAITLELAVRRALEEACPDLLGFEVEGAPAPAPEAAHDPAPAAAPRPPRDWTTLEELPQFEEGEARSMEAAGVSVMLSRLNGRWYAYRNLCPACADPLRPGRLEEGRLECCHGHAYDIRQAGRAVGASELHLAPIPLLCDEGVVKVALG